MSATMIRSQMKLNQPNPVKRGGSRTDSRVEADSIAQDANSTQPGRGDVVELDTNSNSGPDMAALAKAKAKATALPDHAPPDTSNSRGRNMLKAAFGTAVGLVGAIPGLGLLANTMGAIASPTGGHQAIHFGGMFANLGGMAAVAYAFEAGAGMAALATVGAVGMLGISAAALVTAGYMLR